MNPIQFSFLKCVVTVLSINQFTIAAEQWNPGSLDVYQLYYSQILDQYLLSYYSYLNQHDFILNNQNLNYPNNIAYTDLITNTTSINPKNVFKIENIPTNEKQTTIKVTFPQKHKILLTRKHKIKPIKLANTKLRFFV